MIISFLQQALTLVLFGNFKKITKRKKTQKKLYKMKKNQKSHIILSGLSGSFRMKSGSEVQRVQGREKSVNEKIENLKY